jgi:hypothetical protein
METIQRVPIILDNTWPLKYLLCTSDHRGGVQGFVYAGHEQNNGYSVREVYIVCR